MRTSFRLALCATLIGGLTCGCGGGTATRADDSGSSSSSGPEKSGVGPGMNAAGEVIDPAKVESGYGQRVKVGDWDGEVTGKPAPGTCFTKLHIGMPMKEVTDICGPATDQGAYVTGKAFIPFYFGSDRNRFELAYKAQGRLIFAGGSLADPMGLHLIWIIYSANDTGYR